MSDNLREPVLSDIIAKLFRVSKTIQYIQIYTLILNNSRYNVYLLLSKFFANLIQNLNHCTAHN